MGQEIKKLNPRKLVPPPEVRESIIKADSMKISKNCVLRFFHIFFGEGF